MGGLFHWLVGLGILEALLFGALISATDPVAVIAIFKEVGAPKRLVTLVEGESLFNDATAIVVFSILLGMIEGAAASLSMAALRFLYVFVGGTVVGLVLGYLFAKIIEHVENDELVEITLSTVLAESQRTAPRVGQNATVQEVATVMAKQRKAAVVMEGEVAVGIFTPKDLLFRVVAKGLPVTTEVGDVMTAEPDTVGSQMTILDALHQIKGRVFVTLGEGTVRPGSEALDRDIDAIAQLAVLQ